MSEWPSKKGKEVLAALLRNGWVIKRITGSHRVLSKVGKEDVVFAFGESEEIGPIMLRRIAKQTGLTPKDL